MRAFGRDISVQAIGGALAVALVATALAIWHWHNVVWEALVDAWSWLGSYGSLHHWLILLLILLTALGAITAAVAYWPVNWWPLKPEEVVVQEPRPVAEAEAFRDDYEKFLDAFLAWRDDVHFNGAVIEDAWQDDYRKLRRAALDSFQPIRDPLRYWFRRIDEHWTSPWPGEPVWHDIDGPDESDESIIDKFLMPLTLPDAVQFWHGFIPG
jgi:hypothetical protein